MYPSYIYDVPGELLGLTTEALQLGPSLEFFEACLLHFFPVFVDLSRGQNIIVSKSVQRIADSGHVCRRKITAATSLLDGRRHVQEIQHRRLARIIGASCRDAECIRCLVVSTKTVQHILSQARANEASRLSPGP